MKDTFLETYYPSLIFIFVDHHLKVTRATYHLDCKN